MKFRILATIRLIGMVLVTLRLCFVPFESHLRCGIEHAVCWIIVIAAVLALFCVPQTISSREWIKRYLEAYSFSTCSMALYPSVIVISFIMTAFAPEGWCLRVIGDCFAQALIPRPVECENITYVVHKWEDVNYIDNNKRFRLYGKAPLAEHLISIRHTADIKYEKGYARRVLEVDGNKGILKVEVDVYTDYDLARTKIRGWEIDREETK